MLCCSLEFVSCEWYYCWVESGKEPFSNQCASQYNLNCRHRKCKAWMQISLVKRATRKPNLWLFYMLWLLEEAFGTTTNISYSRNVAYEHPVPHRKKDCSTYIWDIPDTIPVVLKVDMFLCQADMLHVCWCSSQQSQPVELPEEGSDFLPAVDGQGLSTLLPFPLKLWNPPSAASLIALVICVMDYSICVENAGW